MSGTLKNFRVFLGKATFASAMGIVAATIAIFILCRAGVFTGDNVDAADHLQDILQMIVSWLLILSLLTFIFSWFGLGKKVIVAAFASAIALGPLIWLFFVNGLRRN